MAFLYVNQRPAVRGNLDMNRDFFSIWYFIQSMTIGRVYNEQYTINYKLTKYIVTQSLSIAHIVEVCDILPSVVSLVLGKQLCSLPTLSECGGELYIYA